MHSIDRKRYFWVVLSALAQGLLLAEYITAASGIFLALPLTIVIAVPFAFWLTQEYWGRRLKRFLGALALILSLFYAYRLWSVYPADGFFYHLPSQSMDTARIIGAAFLFLPFFQCRIATWNWRVPYSDIFFQLCRNVFLLFQAAIVTSVFWGLLLTASLLFDIVGLSYVLNIVFNPFMAIPVTSITVALSITLALKHPGIDSLGRWILSILAWLLPPFSVLSAIFLACLPYSGLKTLWSTGQASSLMLLLQLATILLANAAWLDGTRSPFKNKLVNLTAKASLLCLPIYTALCLYSLGLRVQQYGLSVDRIHAFFLVTVTGIWGLGYAGTVLLRQWPSAIGRINTAAAIIMALIVAAMNSPMLDPCRLAANNQVDRLIDGHIAPADFDYLYLRFNLGRYGNYALNRLKDQPNIQNAELIKKHLETALSRDSKEYWKSLKNNLPSENQRYDILRNAKVLPKGRSLPKSLMNSLVSLWETPSFGFLSGVRRPSELTFIYKKVLNDGDEKNGEELLLIRPDVGIGFVLGVTSEEAKPIGYFQWQTQLNLTLSDDLSPVPARFMDIMINNQRLTILPVD